MLSPTDGPESLLLDLHLDPNPTGATRPDVDATESIGVSGDARRAGEQLTREAGHQLGNCRKPVEAGEQAQFLVDLTPELYCRARLAGRALAESE